MHGSSIKLIHGILAAAGLLAALASPATAQTELERVKAAGVLRIGTEGTCAPCTFHDASGALTGFDVEIGRAIAPRLGVKPEFLEGKWDGLIAGLDANRYDAVINEAGITDARKRKSDFSDPYVASKAVLIVKSDDDAIKSFPDLKGKKAAQSLTSNFGELARQNGATLVPNDGFDQSIQLVLQGRADATVNDSLSYYDFKKKQPNAPVKIAAQPSNADYAGVIIRKNEPEFLAAIDKALVDMKADGTDQKIADRYFGQDVSK